MTGISQALHFIDKNLFEPLTVEDIAGAARLSPYHFSRLFTAIIGESVISYVRRRRLAVAAMRLVKEPETPLAELAFDCGFESQEAFTRAFKRTLGMTPGELKRRGGIDHFDEAEKHMTVMDLGNRLTLESGVKERGAFRVAGLSGRFDRASKAAIPALWDRLAPSLPLAGQAGWATYGLCWSVNTSEGAFNYIAAAELEPGAPAPRGFEVFEVPAQTYIVFRHEVEASNLHRQMSSACEDIWSNRLAKSGYEPSGGPDFEYYPGDFMPNKPGTLFYWIPVRT